MTRKIDTCSDAIYAGGAAAYAFMISTGAPDASSPYAYAIDDPVVYGAGAEPAPRGVSITEVQIYDAGLHAYAVATDEAAAPREAGSRIDTFARALRERWGPVLLEADPDKADLKTIAETLGFNLGYAFLILADPPVSTVDLERAHQHIGREIARRHRVAAARARLDDRPSAKSPFDDWLCTGFAVTALRCLGWVDALPPPPASALAIEAAISIAVTLLAWGYRADIELLRAQLAGAHILGEVDAGARLARLQIAVDPVLERFKLDASDHLPDDLYISITLADLRAIRAARALKPEARRG